MLLASVVAVGHADAAALSVVGGQTTTLPGSFNPTGSPAIGPGTSITYFDSTYAATHTAGTYGLFATPNAVTLTFQYIGFEAGWTNISAAQFTYGAGDLPMFTNQTTGAGTTAPSANFNLTASAGLVPFLFQSITNNNSQVVNGGGIASGMGIAFAKISDSVFYILLDDGGAGPDKDWDDMVVQITATDVRSPGSGLTTPIPASLPLFASGLGVLGLFSRRKKAKASAANA